MTATATVRERPILFSGSMVRAVLDGKKTQTRRVLKTQPPIRGEGPDRAPVGEVSLRPDMLPTGPTRGYVFCLQESIGMRRMMGSQTFAREFCPYGGVGDRLWVRESLIESSESGWCYRADMAPVELDSEDPRVPVMVSWAYHKRTDYCASIHMPRWASRLTLEITEVRVERLQSISYADILAEGCPIESPGASTADHDWYRNLWDSLNASRGYGWDANPWVWCLTFKTVTA